MNKKQKILTLVFTLLFLVSIVVVNASALDLSVPLDEIPGYTEDCFYAIYGEDYVILQLGTLYNISNGFYPEELFFSDTYILDRLNEFLYESEQQFYSPSESSGVYYEGIHVDYIELCFLDLDEDVYVDDGLLIRSDALVFNTDHDYIMSNGIVLLWKNSQYEYGFDVNADVLTSICTGEMDDSLVYAVCYFNGATPYDTNGENLSAKIEELKNQNTELQTQNTELQTQNADLQTQNTDLQTQNTELQTQKTELVEECKELQRVSHEHFVRANTLQYKLLEMENANAIDELFTGTAQSILIFIRGVADLGYSPAPGINITLGGLLTVSVIAAFVVFILRMIFGGSKGD